MENATTKFKAGMYLLETLTAGMYNEPLSIYREYIQNSVDSFDTVIKQRRQGPHLIKIDIDPSAETISIYDNGEGIPKDRAQEILSTIGSSMKWNGNQRGFRGIGRLGGLAFCEKGEFRTKYSGENVESVQEWNSQEMRHLLDHEQSQNMDLKSLFERTTKFYQLNGKKKEGSYFQVRLHGVTSFRNYIMDISKIARYLKSVAPLPFDPSFQFSSEIAKFLRKKVRNYGEYAIKLNGAKLFKPYKDHIKSHKYGDDLIGIKTFEIRADQDVLAYGWYGVRRDLIGSIREYDSISGLNVKVGNITIGDGHLLDGCFRERRFNSYMIGEVHAVSTKLIPNSRRDDFIDNVDKTRFYDAIEKEVGLPISKEIRAKSRERSLKILIEPASEENVDVEDTNQRALEHTEKLSSLSSKPLSLNRGLEFHILKKLFKVCSGCEKMKTIRKEYGI